MTLKRLGTTALDACSHSIDSSCLNVFILQGAIGCLNIVKFTIDTETCIGPRHLHAVNYALQC